MTVHLCYESMMMVKSKDVTHITDVERLMYFYALKYNKGYKDGGGERSPPAES
jgi:hypothetical protein